MNMFKNIPTESDKQNFSTLGFSVNNFDRFETQIESMKQDVEEPALQFQSAVSKYLPDGKIISFEEQLLIDQRRQQLLNQKRFQMILNVKQAQSNFKRKSTAGNTKFPSGLQMTGYQARKASLQTTKTASANSLHSFAKEGNNHLTSAASASYGVGVEWNRQGINSRHKLIRKPDFSLQYTASGNILPRKKIIAKVAQHHFLGDINGPVADGRGSMQETQAQSTFLNHTQNSSIQTQQNSNTKMLNYTSDHSMHNRRKAMHHLLEKVRIQNLTEKNMSAHAETSRDLQTSTGKSLEPIEVPRVLQKMVLPSLQAGKTQNSNFSAIQHARYHSSMIINTSMMKDYGQDLPKKKQVTVGQNNTIEDFTPAMPSTEKPSERERSASQVFYNVSDIANAEFQSQRVKIPNVKKDIIQEVLSTSLQTSSHLVDQVKPKNKESNNDSLLKPTPGPGFKKFQVLSSFMVKDLDKKFQKAGHGANHRMQMRLKNEFDKSFKAKTAKISTSLKPVKYRNLDVGMGQSDSDKKDKASKDNSKDKSPKISYQTTSSDFSSSDKKSVVKYSSDDDVFKQTKTNVELPQKLRRKQQPIREQKTHPILPKGMTKKTLYDDQLFNKWLKECFRPYLPLQEDLVRQQMARNLKRARRRHQRLLERQNKRKASSDESQGISSSQNDSQSSHSSEKKSQKVAKPEEEKTLAEQFEEQLEKQKQKQINAILKIKNVDSDPELEDKQKVKQLVEQIKIVEEDFTLKLSKEVSQILTHFNVTIEGTLDKRRHKRNRLVKHFLRQFQKFLQLEKEWAFDQKTQTKEPNQSEIRKIAQIRLDRKEKDLMNDIQRLGEKGIETLQKRLEYQVLYKLLDQQEEEAEQMLLEAKGKALKELLQQNPPSKKMLDFQNRLQPVHNLEEVKLEPNQNESMSPQRKFVTSSYGIALISELKHSKLHKDRVKHSLDRRMGFDANNIQLDMVEYIRAPQIVKKLQSTLALLNSSFVAPEDSQRQKLEVQVSKKVEKPPAISAALQKKQREIERKHNLEKFENLEVFEQSRLQQQYFESLKVQKLNENDRDVLINNLYSELCIKKENVQDLPIFARIKQNTLTLTGYNLNSGVCKALGAYLAESNWRIDKSYILKELVLDNNDISDNDFAQILAGISVQGQLQKLSYGRNNFGLHSVAQIERLIEEQSASSLTNLAHVQLNEIRLIKVKTNPEVLSQLFFNCLPKMLNLQQLKLQGIFLGNNDIVQGLMNGLSVHSERLELLDLQDTQLTVSQLQVVTEELKSFKVLLSLNLSYNIVRDVSELLVSNICELITMESKLNHLSLSYMALSFKVCNQITQAASHSQSLCSMHLSGNQLNIVQQQFLLRILGIMESELETTFTPPNQISTEEIKAVLKKEMNPQEKSLRLNSSERRSQMAQNRMNAQSNINIVSTSNIIPSMQSIHSIHENRENLEKSKEKSYLVHKIINSYASKDNRMQIAKMHSLQDAQSGSRSGCHNNLVFTRQVYNPELMFNQDTHKENVQHDYQNPFSWHVQQKSDGCYICEQWRYCILYFSRKQVVQGDFFIEVQAGNVRVSLDKVCGFQATSEDDQNDQPWLIGTFTALSKSRLAYTADFQNLLKMRLQKSRLQIKKKIQSTIGTGLLSQPITKNIPAAGLPISGSRKRLDSHRKQISVGETQGEEVQVSTKKDLLKSVQVRPFDLARHNRKLSQIKSSLTNIDDGQSSDFSVDDECTLLELMQKLKKIDPEALILNFSKSDDPEFESTDDSILVDDVDGASQNSEIKQRNKRQDFYAFAAYVPPGKHLLILRDVGTRAFRKYDYSKVNQSNYGGFWNAEPRSSSKGDLPRSSLLRLTSFKENKSDYFYKELLVEPRQNCILKTYSDPFSYSQLPKKQSKKRQNIMNSSKVDLRKESIFRDWLDETGKDIQDFFEYAIIGKLNFEPDESQGSTRPKQPFPGMMPTPELDPPIFACLSQQFNELRVVLRDSFMELREFFFEVAALNNFSYPSVSMATFTELCCRIGHGYLKSKVKPTIEREKPAIQKAKPLRLPSKINVLDFEEEVNKELYTEDLVRPVSQVLNGNQSRWYAQGESKQSLNDTLTVEMVGFVAHLIKVATIWSRGNADGFQSVPKILQKMLTEDIPLMRQTLCVEFKMIQQIFPQVTLPYDDQYFIANKETPIQALLAHNFRHDTLIANESVNKILKVFQKTLISLFMQLANKSTHMFEFDACGLIYHSLTLSSFRIAKNKPAKQPLLKKIVKNVIDAASGENPVVQTPILDLASIQLCFAKAKMLHTQEREQAEKKPMRAHPTIKDNSSHNLSPRQKKQDVRSQTPEHHPPAINLHKIDYRRLSFVEWLEFLCRVATCVFVVDSKTAGKTKNAALLRLIEDSRKPFAIQLASFLSVFLKQLLITHTKRLMPVLKPNEEAHLQGILEQIPDLDEAIESLDETGERMQ